MSFALGTTSRGQKLRLTDEERSRHLHLVGASGTGKSKLLESMIRQDILKGRGLCLIDPHGTLADAVAEWCAALNIDKRRRVHLIDPKDGNWSAGFNPLRSDTGIDLDARVNTMVETCAEVWGGEDINQTPLLATCLQLVFHALAANDLTLVEALELTSSSDQHLIRQRLTGNLANHVYGEYWRDFSTLSKRDFEERFSSTRRRLLRFLGAPVVRRIVGQRNATVNFREIMDQGDIVIVNLAARGALSEESARLLGAMLTSELRLTAMTRDPVTARRAPFSLYIDECYDYLTGDVEKMLDQTRKFGLHLVLAHQRLAQLRRRSEEIYNGVMTGGQTKIVFGGMDDDDAEIMAKYVYRSSFNLERPKHILDKPVVVDEVPYWLDSESRATSESSTRGGGESQSWNSATGSSASSSFNFSADDGSVVGMGSSEGLTTGETAGAGTSSSWADTTGSSHTRGRSQTLKPVRQMMPTAVHSLDEELHFAIVNLRELPNQAAIVKRRGHPPVHIRTDTVKPPVAWSGATDDFIDRSRESSPYITSAETADVEILTRFRALRGAGPSDDVGLAEPDSFWSE